MKNGLSGTSIPEQYPFAEEIQQAAVVTQSSPCALYAIAWRETLSVAPWIVATYGVSVEDFISNDGGHGIFQLTSQYPSNWANPYANALYAATKFYDVFFAQWVELGYDGTTGLKLAADSYNAGPTAVDRAHAAGNADAATTGGNYGSDVVRIYTNLVGRFPINEGR